MALAAAAAMLSSASPVPAAASSAAAVGEPLCGDGCTELDRLAFDHPTWGPSELVVSSMGELDAGSCRFAVVDQHGAVQWERGGAGCDFGGSIFRPAPDAHGNLFIEYSTLRYPGITVLRPVADGMSDFGSLPPSDTSDGNSGRFVDSQLFDVDGDGKYEIVSLIRPCEPTCADGEIYWQTFAWNGSDFVADICTQGSWPTIPVQATPEAGGTVVGNVPQDTCGVQTTHSAWLMAEWIPVAFEDVLGWAPSEAFVPPPTEPPANRAPWAQPEPAQVPGANSGLSGALPMSVGANGQAVVELQLLLLSAGISTGEDGTSGRFGFDTARAVAMLHDETFAMVMSEDPGDLGVLTAESLATLMTAAEQFPTAIENSPCAEPSVFVQAAQADGPWWFRISEIRCSGGWATAPIREYGWTDGSTLFFTVGDAGPALVGSVYAENGCELYGVPPESWEFLGCGAPPVPEPTPPACDTYTFNDQYPIRRCDEGYAVAIIQQSLGMWGYPVEVDGYFGPGTELAVRAFQEDYSLEVDGLVGQRTWGALTDRRALGVDLDGNGTTDPDEVILGE
jgi:hypothetical protein